jgi:hypothetical protein
MNFVPFRSYKSLEILKMIVISVVLTTFMDRYFTPFVDR